MKVFLCLIWFIAALALCWIPAPASAQSAQQTGAANPDQWISHQMNQPPPTQDKYAVSQDRLDEVRDLYLQAKQEAEKKAASGDNGKK
jgi:hypothetical protein